MYGVLLLRSRPAIGRLPEGSARGTRSGLAGTDHWNIPTEVCHRGDQRKTVRWVILYQCGTFSWLLMMDPVIFFTL